MSAVAVQGDTVMSPDGSGTGCSRPLETFVDECNTVNVFIGGKPIVVAGNKIMPHNKPVSGGCGTDESVLDTFSATVFVGGKGAGRIGDKYGNNIITKGAPSVFGG